MYLEQINIPRANQSELITLKWLDTVVPAIDSSICHSNGENLQDTTFRNHFLKRECMYINLHVGKINLMRKYPGSELYPINPAPFLTKLQIIPTINYPFNCSDNRQNSFYIFTFSILHGGLGINQGKWSDKTTFSTQ